MSEYDDLVKRLRSHNAATAECYLLASCGEAAAAITRLQSELSAAKREMREECAKVADEWGWSSKPDHAHGIRDAIRALPVSAPEPWVEKVRNCLIDTRVWLCSWAPTPKTDDEKRRALTCLYEIGEALKAMPGSPQ